MPADTSIKTVAVIGAGTMGAGIAAQAANGGAEVLLLDLPSDGPDPRAIARGAVAKMQKAKPSPLMGRKAAKRVTPLSLDHDLERIAEADWVVEAIVERADVKRNLYEKLGKVLKPTAILSSNTSTIPLGVLTEGMSDDLKRRFCITHFFNPPRWMRLLEVVAPAGMDAAVRERLADFADHRMGKGVVAAKDTPGFIANRIGVLWLQAAVRYAVDLGIDVESADALLGRPMGIPKTGVFGLLDLVGLDLMPAIADSLLSTLPADDTYRNVHRDEAIIRKMIEGGLIGRKGKGGFYRLEKGADGTRRKQVIDLTTGEYADARRPTPPAVAASKSAERRARLRTLLDQEDPGGVYAWSVWRDIVLYACSLVPEIADTPAEIDAAMRLGYNWGQGPFEWLDQVGAAWVVEKVRAEGGTIPSFLSALAENGPVYALSEDGPTQALPDGTRIPVGMPSGVLRLSDVKAVGSPVSKKGGGVLWDLGDGVRAFEIATQRSTLDPELLDHLDQVIDAGEAGAFEALVITSDADNFSVGANLGMLLFAVNLAAWKTVDDLVQRGQKVFGRLKYASFPVVGAPAGMALGGGCEMLLHCDRIQAHAESYIGLVEVGAGVVPGWGGTKELMLRAHADARLPRGPMPAVGKVFETVALAKVSTSAAEAQELGFLKPTDGISMNRDRLLADAKKVALKLARDYTPPEPPEGIVLPGASGATALSLQVRDLDLKGMVTPHDKVVVTELASVLTGGPEGDPMKPVGEQGLLDLERHAFGALIRETRTRERIEHLLNTGKPLRN